MSVPQEMGGNPNIDKMGIAQDLGSMEGKEIRIGSGASAMWGMATTVTSNGSGKLDARQPNPVKRNVQIAQHADETAGLEALASVG